MSGVVPWGLRVATAGDVEAIALVWHAGWRDGHLGHVPTGLLAHRGLEQFRDRVPGRLPATTVATVGADLVGFVVVHADEVEQVYVAAPARGSGVAGALLDHAERTVAERYAVAWLAVAAGNARARRFYESRGWHDTGSFDYPAETAAGPMLVPNQRYEKVLDRRAAGSVT